MRTPYTAHVISSWLLRPSGTFAVRTIEQYSSVLGTSIGRVREDNQDRVIAASFESKNPKESFEFFAICDGMGGMQEGAQCAALALGRMISSLLTTRSQFDRVARLRSAVIAANTSVFERYAGRGGTTLTAVLLTRNGGTGVSVGDSRLYQHEHDGSVRQLSVDDTIAGRVAGLEGTNEEIEHSPFADNLAQFIGQGRAVRPQMMDLRPLFSDHRAGETSRPKGVLLTTDGIHRILKQTFADVVKYAALAKEIVERLISVAEWCGGHDNESAIYVAAEPRNNPGDRGGPEYPCLSLQDPFGTFQLVFAATDELGVETERGVQLVHDGHHLRADSYPSSSSSQRPSGVREGGGPYAEQRGTKGVFERGDTTGSLFPQAAPRISRAHKGTGVQVSGKSDTPAKRGGRTVSKGRRKQGKGRKPKGGRKTSLRSTHPEFDILISEESE
nr:protein phosphatase 2C domain-containing protein [uncultured Steroidobacter sp.]